MKTNIKMTLFAAAIAGLALIPTVTKADIITYTWSPDTSKGGYIGANDVKSSGTLDYNTQTGQITDFDFTYSHDTDTYYFTGFSGNSVLGNGDLVLNGTSLGGQTLYWSATGYAPPDENSATTPGIFLGWGSDTIYGDWTTSSGGGSVVTTPVPEPTTVVAGALMLLPFGMCAMRSIRRNRN